MKKNFDCDEDKDNLPCEQVDGCADCLVEDACKAEEAMTRRLFEEVTPDIERFDAWSGPHGFLFDEMTHPTKLALSQQFLDAADQLVDRIRQQECEDYRLAFPALFLYRHAIELIVKCALGGDVEGHRLDELADILQRRCQEQHKQDVPTWIMDRLNEFARHDPNSTAFRYAESTDRKTKQRVWLIDSAHVDLYHLQRAMTVLYTALANVVGKIRGQEHHDPA